MKLKDRVAIVTGAAMGIGESIALQLAKEGADVVVADIKLEQANKVVDEIKALGAKAIAIKADVSKSQEVNQMVKTTLDEFGKIDILVNNAGGRADKRQLFHESTEEVWDYIINSNLKGVRNCCRAVIGHMMQRRCGKIVSIASGAGVSGSVGLADYSAAKAGIIGFTKTLAKEVGSYGINVNSVSPGTIGTARFHQNPDEVKERYKKRIYLGRFGKPEDIANMVAFLVSDEASFITGQNCVVCGGYSLGF